MTEQRANSGSPLAGLAPASAAQADVAPPFAALTSDAAADAAAWARIDRALQSTRKWLWVFVIVAALVSGFAWWRVVSAKFDPYSGDPIEEHLTLRIAIALVGFTGIATVLSLLAMLVSQFRSRTDRGPAGLVTVMRMQAVMWWACGAMALACVVFFVSLAGAIFLDDWRNDLF